MRIWIGAGLAALLAACGGDKGPVANASVRTDWRQVATSADRDRLRHWRDAWMAGLGRARVSGQGAAIAAEGALFQPDHALAEPVPPPGRYRCRVFKLGAKGTAMREFTAYPPVACGVARDGGGTSLYKTAGAQRPVGRLFDAGSRAIFLGTLVLSDEARPIDYGRDAGRDLAGYVERIGDKRWRLVLPYPHFESTIDIVELVPVS